MFTEPGRTNLPSDVLAYEQEVRELDDQVARLVADLDASLGPERFVLVITADHGEEFGEHGGIYHGQLYDEVLHVPLFVRWPGKVPAGRTIDEQVSLVDVAPTLLDLVGLDATVESGLSLRPLLEGTAAPLDRPYLFAESPRAIGSHYARHFIARRPTGKCFSYELPDLDRCFDLASDPDEQNPLPPSGDDETLWLAARTYGESALGASAPLEPAATPAPHADPERVEKLRALGYVE
jgi:arylsulfatase A-like enzyme